MWIQSKFAYVWAVVIAAYRFIVFQFLLHPSATSLTCPTWMDSRERMAVELILWPNMYERYVIYVSVHRHELATPRLNWSSVHSVPFNYCHAGILSYLFSECSYTPGHILQQSTKQTGGHHLVNFRWLISKFEREKTFRLWELHHIFTIKQIFT